MPIILDDLSQNTQIQNVYLPTFFSDKLTGRGKTTGLLSLNNSPLMIPPDETTSSALVNCTKRTNKNGMTTVQTIPLNPLYAENWQYMEHQTITDEEYGKLLKIGVCKTTQKKLYLRMTLNSIGIEEIVDPNGKAIGIASTTKKIHSTYMIQYFYEHDPNSRKYRQIAGLGIFTSAISGIYTNAYAYIFSGNPLVDIQKQCTTLQSEFDIDAKTVLNFLSDYNIYDAACEQSEVWQTCIHDTMDQLFQNIQDKYTDSKGIMYTQPSVFMIQQIRYIMSYNIPLDLYKNIYQSIKKHFKDEDVNLLCKENLNLLLSSTMDALEQGKSQITSFQPMDPKKPLPTSVQNLSPQQKNACLATEPLVIVQSGAGSGKSTTIKARIDYMCASGVDPKDIMVLSFTNAAADHIKELNPSLHSMTIASMIHELYSTNFTTHELSSLDTIINSIDIYYGNLPPIVNGKEPIQKKFKNVLYKLKKNEPNAYTEVNNFIERNYDAVIDTLNTIKQTSLELEIIICYQKIDMLNEPDTITSKYLIMDEVQDNSVFEFIYILKYVEKHKEPLFLVGDSAQTLYEFRSSNPKAINILEGSGTFQNYKLTVNYRSNQEILNFANVLLQNIEANQYANIQLQANSLATVTEQSFLDRVNFNYHRLPKLSDLKDALPVIMGTEVKPYLDKCIARKEQIAFLAYTKNEINQIENLLKTMYPTKQIVNMIPVKPFNSTIMSGFIKNYWNELKFAPAANMIQIIEDEIMRKLPYLVYNSQKAEQTARDMLASWKHQNKGIIAAWTNQVNAGQITQDVFMDLLKENMLNYEIMNNAILQAKISQKNAKQKETDKIRTADFLLSTIHSAKGLEFENVVVLHKNRNNMNEADKRMYYVAFTRAMNTEYVLSYDTVASPQIEADYHTILQTLHAKSPAPNSPLNNMPHPKEKRGKK